MPCYRGPPCDRAWWLLWRKRGAEDARCCSDCAEVIRHAELLTEDGWEPATPATVHPGDFLDVVEPDGTRYRAEAVAGMGCRVWGRVREKDSKE